METYLTWFKIFLLRQLRKPLYYLQLVVMIIAIIVIGSISIPDKNNLCVGIMFENEKAEENYGEVFEKDTSAKIKIYDDEEMVKKDISSQKTDCGFVVPEQIDDDEQIKYYYSPFSRAGELQKEETFSSIYEILSQEIIIQADEEIYGDSDEERLNYWLTKNEELINYEQIISIDYENISDEELEKDSGNNVYTIQGIAGLFLMLTVVLGGVNFGQKTNAGNVLQSLSGKSSLKMQLVNDIAMSVIPAIIALLSVLFSGKSRGILIEISGIIILIVYLEIWLLFIRFIRKNSKKDIEQEHIWAVILVLMQIVICPVFVNLADKLVLIKYISLISPLGLYLFL